MLFILPAILAATTITFTITFTAINLRRIYKQDGSLLA